MPGKLAPYAIRPVVTWLAVVATALSLCVSATVTARVNLLTSTLVVIAGNDNPDGLSPQMQQQLGGDPWYPGPNTNQYRPGGTFGHGYLDTANNPASPFYGWDFVRVEWPANIELQSSGGQGYELQQQQGVHNVDQSIARVLSTLGPGEKVVAVGYSSSANVLVREMRDLQGQVGGAPATDRLSFFLMGSPNRPHGGILQRFPGLYIPDVDIRLDGSTPIDTPYATTDIGWEYDTASDFPLYPLNLLADLNSLIAGPIVHSNYYNADVNGGGQHHLHHPQDASSASAAAVLLHGLPQTLPGPRRTGADVDGRLGLRPIDQSGNTHGCSSDTSNQPHHSRRRPG